MPAVIWLVPRMKYRLAVSGLLLHSYRDLLSSESSFLVRLLPLLLLPLCILLLFPPLSPRSADAPCGALFLSFFFSLFRKAKTFSAAAIVGLLIALGFPPFFCPAFLSSYLNLSFSLPHFFSSTHLSSVFRVSSPKLSGTLVS